MWVLVGIGECGRCTSGRKAPGNLCMSGWMRPQGLSECFRGEEKYIFSVPGIEPRLLGDTSRNIVRELAYAGYVGYLSFIWSR
jgi:hypothetical protein